MTPRLLSKYHHQKELARRIIEDAYHRLSQHTPGGSQRDHCVALVQVFKLLTGEMPQVPGLDLTHYQNEFPAVEWASPRDRELATLNYVYPGSGFNPDVVIEGDHNDEDRQTPQDHLQLEAGRADQHSPSDVQEDGHQHGERRARVQLPKGRKL